MSPARSQAKKSAVSPANYAVLTATYAVLQFGLMLECANTENCRQAKIIAVGSKDIVFDKTAIILHMLEDPGMFLILSRPLVDAGRVRTNF